jgi:glycosyltransferase A (GT-A) superfamily protein (DUF2064 family)
VSVEPAPRSGGDVGPSILVAAKAPLPGRAKTRLTPPLPPPLAARLAEAFLTDVLAAARAVDAGAGFLCRASDAGALRRRFDVPLVIQTGPGLTGALASGLRTGALVVAGDVPGIRPESLRAAGRADAGIVLAPSHDGGFSLIGMRPFVPGVLEGIRWSTGSVLDQAIAAGRAAGLSVALLDPIPDVDDAADLAALDLTWAPATRAVLEAAGSAAEVLQAHRDHAGRM